MMNRKMNVMKRNHQKKRRFSDNADEKKNEESDGEKE